MQQYQQFLQHILENGTQKNDRTGTGTKSVFGYQMRFDLNNGFPLVTTKKSHIKSIIHELLWFIAGDTNIQYLCKNGCNIWNDWPYAKYQKSSDFKGEVTTLSTTALVALSKVTLTEEKAKEIAEAEKPPVDIKFDLRDEDFIKSDEPVAMKKQYIQLKKEHALLKRIIKDCL